MQWQNTLGKQAHAAAALYTGGINSALGRRLLVRWGTESCLSWPRMYRAKTLPGASTSSSVLMIDLSASSWPIVSRHGRLEPPRRLGRQTASRANLSVPPPQKNLKIERG